MTGGVSFKDVVFFTNVLGCQSELYNTTQYFKVLT